MEKSHFHWESRVWNFQTHKMRQKLWVQKPQKYLHILWLVMTHPIYWAIGPQFCWCLPQYVYKNANPPQIEIIPPHRHTRAIEPLVLTRQLFHASILARKFRHWSFIKKDVYKNGNPFSKFIDNWCFLSGTTHGNYTRSVSTAVSILNDLHFVQHLGHPDSKVIPIDFNFVRSSSSLASWPGPGRTRLQLSSKSVLEELLTKLKSIGVTLELKFFMANTFYALPLK